MNERAHVIIAGAGIAGLTAAATLARGGARVTVLEKAGVPGGRAATSEKAGFSLNIGPHALYAGGAGKRILDDLGVAVSGRVPRVTGYAYDNGALHTLPGGMVSLLTTGLLPLAGKLEVAKLLGSLSQIDPAPHHNTSVKAWIERTARTPEVRRLLAGLVRVSSYAADFERLSAGAAILQLKSALAHNVLYLDGGWQTLVDGLAKVARAHGAEIRTDAKVTSADVSGGEVRGVLLGDGSRLASDAVVVAASPAIAASIAPSSAALSRVVERAIPARAACLDLALSKLPAPRNTFALGLDQPYYFSVHSKTAKLAPEGGAVIHVAEYLATDAKGDAARLEAFLDRLQPGWRDVVVERRFLPHMTVAHSIPLADDGGLAGRPDVDAAGIPGLYLAGDWVGPEGMIGDAAFASGRRAAEAILARSRVALAA